MKKIIFLVPYSLFPEFNPSEANFWKSWTKIARAVKKHAEEEFVIEVWKPEKLFRYPVSFEIDGVKAKVFPSFRWGWLEVSPQLWSSLRRVKKREKVVFYLHEYHCVAHWLVTNVLGDAPIIAQHHGGLPIRRVAKDRKSRVKRILYKIAEKVEERTLRKISHFFVLTESERDFITACIRQPANIQMDPIDFEKFKLMDKLKSRRSLGLSPRKRYLIFVGRFLKVRGVDLVVKAFESLGKKYPNLELLMIGGQEGDELFNLVVNSKATYLGKISHGLMPYYFSAADVLLAPSRVEGVGVVNVLEALACGVPVVTTLKDLFPSREWNKIGKATSIESFTKDVEQTLRDLPFPPRICRHAVQKYHGEEKIARRTIEVADKLFKKFY